MKNPSISVIIPVYNGAEFIGDTLQSIIKQSFEDFEVICVNDGSTDESLAVINGIAKWDNRIKVITKKNEGTATRAIKEGLKNARGRYFMYSSQDDFFSIDLLEKNFKMAEKHSADAVLPDMQYYYACDAYTQSQGIFGVGGDRSKLISGRDAFILSLDWTIHGFALWKMDLIKNIGFEDYGLSSDEYSTRIFFFNCSIVAFTDATFFYRQDNPNAITKKWDLKQLYYLETCDRLNEFCIKNNISNHYVLRLHKATFFEIMRIKILFLKNKSEINFEDQRNISFIINSYFLKNYNKFKKIRFQGKFGVFQKIASMSLLAFNVYCFANVAKFKMTQSRNFQRIQYFIKNYGK